MGKYWPGTTTLVTDVEPTAYEGQNNTFQLDPPKKMGRPLGSPNLLTRPLKELASQETERCLAVLIRLRDTSEEDSIRLAAANAILDRAHGKPRPTTEQGEDSQVTIIVSPPTIPAPTITPALPLDAPTQQQLGRTT